MSDDILVRIPLAGASQFHPLALAPGLPMLDARKLTYQVLLGWFGDVLAEPEHSDEGVLFHVQQDGRRQGVVEKTLATSDDLNGPLAGEFGKLKKALFEVRPVSPSERLIFNRLQPPIGNHDGFLYRVRTEGRAERLIWCWGFQKRSVDAHAMLCSSPDCSLLFLQHDASVRICPRCEEPLRSKQPLRNHRSRFPVGALTATVILGGLAAGTYWFPVLTGASDSGELPVFPSQLGAATNRSDEAVSVVTPAVPEAASPETPAGDTAAETEDTGSGEPQIVLPEPGPAPDISDSPESLGELSWHDDYATAYEEAAGLRRRLVMLFAGSSDQSRPDSRGGFEAAEVEAALGDSVRLQLPVDFKVAGSETSLLEHRSFRHLGGQPGVVIIELSDPASPLFGQAVSAMPLPVGDRFPLESLKRLLDLPAGSIGQRSLLFEIRSAVDSAELDSALVNAAPHVTLSDLANRNARFMAHFERDELFEAGRRQEILHRTFGEAAEFRELTFATPEPASIQSAASQAVQHWTRQTTEPTALTGPATAYGLDLFQSPESGRWFATLILVR